MIYTYCIYDYDYDICNHPATSPKAELILRESKHLKLAQKIVLCRTKHNNDTKLRVLQCSLQRWTADVGRFFIVVCCCGGLS